MTSPKKQPNPVPPISHGEAPDTAGEGEPGYEQYADLLRKSFEPATNDWTSHDLAEILLFESRYQPGTGGRENAIEHHRQTQAQAKRAIVGKLKGVHPDLAHGLYYVALSRAWVEHDAWITKLTNEEVAEGLKYLQRCDWVRNHPVLMERLSELARRVVDRGDHP